MRHLLPLLAGSCLLLPGCSTTPTPSAPSESLRPNILWISAEDLSPRLGCYADSLARTPTLDRLASDGRRFTRAFTTAGVCSPSRAAIITGMYQSSIGAHHMRTTTEPQGGMPTPYFTVPPPEVKAFPEYLRAAGYYCTNNSKTDYQFGEPRTVWDESSASAHWRNRAEGQPFFAVFNFMTTHESQIWPRADRPLITDPTRVEVPPYYPDTDVVRRDLAQHYDNIATLDTQIAELLRQLDEDGLADNTIVFFWGDHGDGLPRAKRWPNESGTRVPLIVRWPGHLERGSVDERLVSLVDLGPTVLSMAGVPIPDHMQGRAFLGGPAAPERAYVYAARDRIDESYDYVRSVRDRRYRLIRNFFPDKPYILPVAYRNRMPTMQEILRLDRQGALSGPQALWARKTRPPEELYDTEADPWEINNLIDDPEHREIAQRLRTALADWREEIHDMGDIPETDMVERMWPGHQQPPTEPAGASPAAGRFESSIEVTLSCPTEGASIAYTTESGEEPHWLLYSGPLRLASDTDLRVRATRYGYKESEERVFPYRFGPEKPE
ncbi:MAG: sulfatase-like hydrolase/transferase [Acidobacteriota bacterium]